MKGFLLLLSLSLAFAAIAQQRIDGDFAFQTDPAKKYSIYVPSAYDASSANQLMLGLHPLNTARWDAVSWCDTLIDFAEANNLLLICPDGGVDGAVDSPIDTAFTTVLLDSMIAWYNIDEAKIWAMGFSWGGRTTYSYGLRHADRFAGFLPIGAAVTGTDQINGFTANAKNKPFYIVHGSNDSPGTRFTPVVTALEANEACVETNLLAGVGHTIDFPNRNQILTEAFNWLQTSNCTPTNTSEELTTELAPSLFPNPIQRGAILYLKNWKNASLYSTQGKVEKQISNEALSTEDLTAGVYFLIGEFKGKKVSRKVVVQ